MHYPSAIRKATDTLHTPQQEMHWLDSLMLWSNAMTQSENSKAHYNVVALFKSAF